MNRFHILLGIFCFSVFPARGEKPNILLIMADDVGCDAIGCYGGESYPTTHIDALATGGIKFNHGYAMPVCHPSRICLMTGRYPFRFGPEGMKWGMYPTAAEGNSIADALKSCGYTTAVAGKWQLCLMKNDLLQPARTGFDEWCLFGWHEGGRYHDPLLYQNGKLRTDTEGKYGPDLYVEFIVDFMKRSLAKNKPFFAYYPMALCHDVTDDLKDHHVAYYKDGRWMNYAEMVASMDDMVGRLATAIVQLGIRSNTLIIFTTDNGTASSSYLYVDEKGKMARPMVQSIRNGKVVPGGKGRLDDTGTRVPFIVNWPGKIEAGTESNAMTDLTDLLPTLVELAGGEAPNVQFDGISFAPLLFGGKRDRVRPWIYSEHRGKRCIRSPRWRLYSDGRIFDLASDPDETKPLPDTERSAEASAACVSLQTALDALQHVSTDSK